MNLRHTHQHLNQDAMANWRSAQEYVERFYSKSLLQRLAEDVAVAKCLTDRHSPLWADPTTAKKRQEEYKEASRQVKVLRKKKQGEASSGEIEEAYGRYARAMNDMEACTKYRFNVGDNAASGGASPCGEAKQVKGQ
ncbi:hypothetical protein VE03_10598 [Pseudogymnoascus sp. 23342-1-I1]|nr:hypothetical protein VE03_10598 [Pseudogymnoascus sp. 23342-1-I1]